MTENAPPRKPKGARRWVWMVVAAGLLVVYVGAYAVLRLDRRLAVLSWSDPNGPRMTIADVGGQGRFGFSVDTWRTRLFRPCIAVEEWWRSG